MDHQDPARRVTFHSGKTFTADDVVYTINRIVSNQFSGTLFWGPIDIKGVKALDKNTVVVPMKQPFGSLVDQLAGGWYYLYVVPNGFSGKGKPDGTGPFACLPELHPRPAQRFRAQQPLLEVRPALSGRPDDQ